MQKHTSGNVLEHAQQCSAGKGLCALGPEDDFMDFARA